MVQKKYDVKGMAEKILALRKTACELKAMSGGIQAVDRNVIRLLASVRNLEIDVVDVTKILGGKD